MPGHTKTRSPVHDARSRAACALFSFSLGIFASWEGPEAGFDLPLTPLALFLVAAALASITLVLPIRPPFARRTSLSASLLFLAIATFALGWGHARLREAPAPNLSSLVADTAELSVFRVTILENPRTNSDRSAWTCLARVRAIVNDAGSTPISQSAWLTVRSATPPRPGDRLVARASFRPIEPPRNPGDFDLRRWAIDRGVAGSLFIPSPAFLRPDESPAGTLESILNACRRTVGSLRSRASDTVDRLAGDASPDARELLRGLLLGENPPSPSHGLSSFYQLGLAHILSISGFHLVVFAGAALAALRIWGDLGQLEPVLVALAILFFLLIVPAGSPLVRAATILLVLLGAELFGRRYDRLTLLCWTAVALLLLRPSELWSLGFQLSFGLTAALLALAPKLSLRLFPPPLGIRPQSHWLFSRARHALTALFVTGLLCWTLSAPWIASNIGIFNPLAILTGIVLTPIIVVALWLGYAALLLGLAFPPITAVLARPIGLVTDFSVSTSGWFDSLPIAIVRLPALSQAWALCATVLLAFWFASARLRLPRFAFAAALLALWAALEITFARRLPPGVEARIYFLDVAPADCTLIRTPTFTAMINAGTNSPRAQGRDLAQVARHLGAWKLDTLILDATNPHALLGAPQVIRTLRPVQLIIAGPADSPSAKASAALALEFGSDIRFTPSLAAALASLPAPFQAGLPTRPDEPPSGFAVFNFRARPQ
ncbi:MAG: ComEC/Rec2 family competence protein [Phycisphaerae bacterium]|nr:ComEC/Rec2 family competence protein [Phycisphaerae bacterium]